MKLSILIPTLPERKHFLNELLENLIPQCNSQIEILTDDRPKSVTTGEKRNDLLARATGEYVWFIDDDDLLFPGAIDAVWEGIEKGVDVIGINGVMTTDGKNQEKWVIALGLQYEKKHGIYHRFPNHITPMKRELAIQVKFKHITFAEDYKWACDLRDSGLLKTQFIVEQPVYHYRVRTKK